MIGDKRYRNRKIGSLMIKSLIVRAFGIGYKTIYVGEIYDYNKASKALFKKHGFNPYKKTERGYSYILELCDFNK